ncbi:Uma2 family endonuclease [Luteolibacter sp. LG18]|uniref:Uma2 family endonuclease n=1 Tax=Luteolibacter sp. LG18 TaxID=2819286 RepID=UPI002B2D97E6|nr:hypothetical protein llg_13520 [Luteolibacter sp. LG18]
MSFAIQLPVRDDQTAFNLRVWEAVLADPSLERLEQRIETDRHGHIIMTPPPGPAHGSRQFTIGFELRTRLGGRVITECPLTTSDGVKAIDVGWYSDTRHARAYDKRCFLEAPEICVEVLSPSNTVAEMEEKKALYFDANASEVWFCEEDGSMVFHTAAGQVADSPLCPGFPPRIDA